MSYADGSLLRNSNQQIYVVQSGARRLIPSQAVFDAAGYRADKVQAISDAALAAIPQGPDLTLPGTDGTILENARAYAAFHSGGATAAVSGLRVAQQQAHDAQLAAKQQDGQRRIEAARADIAARKADADTRLQDAKDGLQTLGQRQGEYQTLMDQQHKLMLSHTARLKIASASVVAMGANEIAYIFNGVPDEACQQIINTVGLKDVPQGGYHLASIDGYDKHGATYFDLVFRRGLGTGGHGPLQQAYWTTADLFKAFVDDSTRLSNRPIWLSSYLREGKVGYSLLWVMYYADAKYRPDWSVYIEVPLDQVQAQIDQQAAKGYSMICQSYVQQSDGSVIGCGLFAQLQTGSTSSVRLVTADEYQRHLDEFAGQKMLPRHLDITTINGEPRFSAVWQTMSYEAYVARHHMQAKELHEQHKQCMDQGMEPRLLVGYSNGDKVHHAALWVRYSPGWDADQLQLGVGTIDHSHDPQPVEPRHLPHKGRTV